MTPTEEQELNEKVARLCGWEFSHISVWGPKAKVWISPQQLQTSELPNYSSDLNACASFEKQFENDCAIWMDYMAKLVGKPWHFAWEANEVWNAVHATAEQRCRAFIAVMEQESGEKEA